VLPNSPEVARGGYFGVFARAKGGSDAGCKVEAKIPAKFGGGFCKNCQGSGK